MSGKIFCFGIKSFVIIFILIFISTSKSQETINEKNSESTKVLELLVINKTTKEPIPDAELTVTVAELSIEVKEEIIKYKTGKDGRCRINLEGKPRDYVRVIAEKDSYASSRAIWSKTMATPQVPSQYTLAMVPGSKIGGKVQNEQEEPIEGVAVGVYYRKEYRDSEAFYATIISSEDGVKTDKSGYWQFNKIPADFDVTEDFKIFLTHPDYISDNLRPGFMPAPITPSPPLNKLRDLSSVMVMKKGVLLSGKVLNSKGEPIQNALISEGSDQLNKTFPDMRTDKDGNFVLKNATTGKFLFTVQAKGYSPDMKQVVIQKDMSPIEFHLEPGHKVSGRIVDKEGNPVAGATIGVGSWRGNQSLEWSTVTDAEGNFRWDEAPANEVLCYIIAKNHMSLNNYLIIGSDKGIVITLQPPLTIHGKVLDAQTGKPVPEFKMIPGIQFEASNSVYWERERLTTFTDGNFENKVTNPYYGHLIRIEADGYLPVDSRMFRSDEGDVAYNLKLQKAEGLSGFVLLPDGKPADSAEVILCTTADTMYVIDDRDSLRRSTPYLITKDDGKFSFPAQSERYIIFVFHKDGYAKITYREFEASSKIVLEPYTTIKGNFALENEPKESQKIYLTYVNPEELRDIRIAQEYRTETDSDGNFEFNHIPPGQATVYWEIKNSMRGALSHGISLDIKSGQINNISFGKKGRTVTGKILIPDYLINLIAWKYSNAMLAVNSLNNPYTQIAVSVKKDGTFHIGDVPAGDYTLMFDAYEASENDSYFPMKSIARLRYAFNIPEMNDGGNDEPIDIGELELGVQNKESYIPSLIGKDLPDINDFNIKQVNDKRILICFIDIEQRPSRNCIIELSKKAQELNAKDIEVFLIHAAKVEKGYLDNWLKENNISFPIGMIEKEFEQTKFNWGVRALPWLILTDKEHIVTDDGFSISDLDEKIQN